MILEDWNSHYYLFMAFSYTETINEGLQNPCGLIVMDMETC